MWTKWRAWIFTIGRRLCQTMSENGAGWGFRSRCAFCWWGGTARTETLRVWTPRCTPLAGGCNLAASGRPAEERRPVYREEDVMFGSSGVFTIKHIKISIDLVSERLHFSLSFLEKTLSRTVSAKQQEFTSELRAGPWQEAYPTPPSQHLSLQALLLAYSPCKVQQKWRAILDLSSRTVLRQVKQRCTWI